MTKTLLIRSAIISLLVSFAATSGILAPFTAKADSNDDDNLKFCWADKSFAESVKTVNMMITAYSSTPDQTDDTPFITASGKRVADGIIANNMLPFGTKVRIPELYGDKIFVVQDRMHSRKGKYHADIWMPSYKEAINFGAKLAKIEILES